MWKNLSYKRKYQLLFLFAALFAVLIYQSVLSKTVTLFRQNMDLSAKIVEASSAPKQLSILQAKVALLDRIARVQQSDTSDNIHEVILGVVSGYCKEKGTLLKSFPEVVRRAEGDYEVQTNYFTVQGGFIDLLQLVYLLEQKQKSGRIASLHFQTLKDPDAKKKILTATIYQQNIKKLK